MNRGYWSAHHHTRRCCSGKRAVCEGTRPNRQVRSQKVWPTFWDGAGSLRSAVKKWAPRDANMQRCRTAQLWTSSVHAPLPPCSCFGGISYILAEISKAMKNAWHQPSDGITSFATFLSPDALLLRPPAHLTLCCSLRPKGSEFSVVAQAQMWQTLAGEPLTISQNDTGFTGFSLSWIAQLTATGMNPRRKVSGFVLQISHGRTNWRGVRQIVPRTASHWYCYWDAVQSFRFGEETFHVCSTEIVIGAVSSFPTRISRNFYFQ